MRAVLSSKYLDYKQSTLMARKILSQQMTRKHSSVETGRAGLWDKLFLWSESCEQSLQVIQVWPLLWSCSSVEGWPPDMKALSTWHGLLLLAIKGMATLLLVAAISFYFCQINIDQIMVWGGVRVERDKRMGRGWRYESCCLSCVWYLVSVQAVVGSVQCPLW